MADLAVTAANVAPVSDSVNNSVTVTGTGGGTVTQGMPVYLDTTDGKWKAADSLTALKAGSNDSGIALSSWSDGQPAVVLVGGDWVSGGTNIVGETYVISATSGKLCPVADVTDGKFVTVLGVGLSATRIRMPLGGPLVSGTAHA